MTCKSSILLWLMVKWAVPSCLPGWHLDNFIAFWWFCARKKDNNCKYSKTWEGVRNSITFLNCFQNILKDEFWTKNIQKEKQIEICCATFATHTKGCQHEHMRVDCVPTKFLDENVLIKWCILPPLWVCSLVSGRFMRNSHDLANSECY